MVGLYVSLYIFFIICQIKNSGMWALAITNMILCAKKKQKNFDLLMHVLKNPKPVN